MIKISVILSIFALAIGMGIGAVHAVENIDPNNDGSQYAYGENVGWLNFEPGGDGGSGAEVTDTAVTGYVWAENIGWINLSPAIYGGVINQGSGVLSGYAWGENVGWINFAPIGGGVTITNGDFDGWAWGENIGWIHLQNPAVPYIVQTSFSMVPPCNPEPCDPTCSILLTGAAPAYGIDICLNNPCLEPETMEFKVWVNYFGREISIVSVGDSGTFGLPGCFDTCITLIPPSINLPPGVVWGIRLVNPVTGEETCVHTVTIP